MTQRRGGKQNRIAVYTAQYREMIILAVFQIHDDGDFQLCKLLERQGIAFRFKTQIRHNAPHILKRRAHLLLIQLFQHVPFRQLLPVKIVQKRRLRSCPAGKIQILLYNIEIPPRFPALYFDFAVGYGVFFRKGKRMCTKRQDGSEEQGGSKPPFCSIKTLLKGYPEFLSSLLIGKRYDGSLSLPIAVFQIQDKCRIEKIKYLNGF